MKCYLFLDTELSPMSISKQENREIKLQHPYITIIILPSRIIHDLLIASFSMLPHYGSFPTQNLEKSSHSDFPGLLWLAGERYVRKG